MEAHAGTVRVPAAPATRSRRSLRRLLGERSAARRARAIQTRHARIRSIPGSEHTHIVLPPKAY
jgi:hypothetical protein